jgi:hypothetical protein
MIAWTALMMGEKHALSIEKSAVKQNFRTDEVDVTWRS